ncbi:hypothetical protein FRC09_016463 [Ceratobasidium sp. 395]|nr:hypothetical protein FRC09_016463 [Ceratobasidium sp. 395]
MDYQTALDFTTAVRSAFVNEPWVFDAFLVILAEYRKQAIDMDDLMLHMRAIFQSHEALFNEFCSFLPQEEAAPEQTPTSLPSASYCPSALEFVSFVKARCAESSPDVYNSFLALISSVDRGELAVLEMYSQICTLFRGDAELLSEFESFFQGEWASDEPMEPYLDNVDEADELDEESMPSITSSPSPSVESFAGTQTPIDLGSPLMSRSMNLKHSSGNGYEYQLQGISVAGEWNS